jgi:multiple sugar transport system permease protein
MLVLGLFTILPIAYSGYLSTVEWDGLSAERPFVGLGNFIRLWQSGALGESAKATMIYTIGVSVGSMILGLAVALLISRATRGASFYRAIYFLPAVTATVAISVVWKLLLDPNSGYINQFLGTVGIEGPNWLRSPTWAMPAVILVGIWKRLGFNTIIYLAGMHTIPRSVYEAAAVDGAGTWATLRRITLPLLAPITLLVMIMGIIDGFLVFDQLFVMTGGGPLGTTDVLGLLLYRTAFRYFDLGGASAIGWFMFAIVAAITMVQWRLYGAGSRGIAQ